MFKTVSYRMMIVVAALLLAITSVGSAGRMAAADMDRAEITAFLAIGGTLDDLCEDGPSHNHVEHCPFCNTVAQADIIAPAGKTWTLTPDPLLLTTSALTRAEQRHVSRRFARGPPQTA